MAETRPYACYLSVDLEDYKHATMMQMGVRPRTDPEHTWKGVRRILSVLNKTDSNQNITFFTTGQVAREQRDLVLNMCRLGHEIACHGDQHENVSALNREGFLQNLRRAKTSLEDACGQQVLGFRAPNFSIDERCTWAHATLLEAEFVYDSSMVKSAPRHDHGAYDVLNVSGHKLFEFPLYRHSITRSCGVRVIGGTYFRILPVSVILTLMKKAVDHGYIPVIYLHPSDVCVPPHPVRWSEMSGLRTFSRGFWVVRQNQWSIGTRTASDKLLAILKRFPNLGPMRAALPISECRPGA